MNTISNRVDIWYVGEMWKYLSGPPRHSFQQGFRGWYFYQNQVHLVFIKVVYPILIVPPFCLPNGLEWFFLDLQYLLFLFPSWFEFWPPEGSKLRSFNDETLVNGWKFSRNWLKNLSTVVWKESSKNTICNLV